MLLKLILYQNIVKAKRYTEKRYLPHIRLADQNPKITKKHGNQPSKKVNKKS